MGIQIIFSNKIRSDTYTGEEKGNRCILYATGVGRESGSMVIRLHRLSRRYKGIYFLGLCGGRGISFGGIAIWGKKDCDDS